MEVREGSCRFGLWHVHVHWSRSLVRLVRFSLHPLEGAVPLPIQRYCAGFPGDLRELQSIALAPGYPYSEVYRRVWEIPYGHTRTYGDIARDLGISPRLVGLAMKRNPTPLVIPCHRVVSRTGPGGFTPDPAIKEALLSMERRNTRCLSG